MVPRFVRRRRGPGHVHRALSYRVAGPTRRPKHCSALSLPALASLDATDNNHCKKGLLPWNATPVNAFCPLAIASFV